MVLHLLDELPSQLDGLDVRAERAPEDPFEETFDLVLDAPQDAHGLGLFPGSEL